MPRYRQPPGPTQARNSGVPASRARSAEVELSDQTVRNGIVAVIVAGTVSGAPSTIAALLSGDSVLAATRAAGTLLGRPSVARGIAAHVALSVSWGVVLTRVLPAGHRAAAGLVAGAAIAALDLGVVGRRFPAICALPQCPQWADHLAFGAVFGAVMDAL
jgi:hypothetical protein